MKLWAVLVCLVGSLGLGPRIAHADHKAAIIKSARTIVRKINKAEKAWHRACPGKKPILCLRRKPVSGAPCASDGIQKTNVTRRRVAPSHRKILKQALDEYVAGGGFVELEEASMTTLRFAIDRARVLLADMELEALLASPSPKSVLTEAGDGVATNFASWVKTNRLAARSIVGQYRTVSDENVVDPELRARSAGRAVIAMHEIAQRIAGLPVPKNRTGATRSNFCSAIEQARAPFESQRKRLEIYCRAVVKDLDLPTTECAP